MNDQLKQLAIADRNPVQETQYQQLLSQAGIPFTIVNGKASVGSFGTGGNGANVNDFVTAATQAPIQQANQQQQQTAENNYQAGIGSAVSTLQNQGTSLDQQYQSLLGSITQAGTVALNTVTTGENNLLASRGITNNSPLYSAQMGSAQLPVETAVGTTEANLGYTQAQIKANLANEIANIQAGGAGTIANLPLSFGSLALAQAANVANIGLAGSQAAQAGAGSRYIPIPGVGLWDTQTNQFTGGVTNNNLTTGGYSILNVK